VPRRCSDLCPRKLQNGHTGSADRCPLSADYYPLARCRSRPIRLACFAAGGRAAIATQTRDSCARADRDWVKLSYPTPALDRESGKFQESAARPRETAQHGILPFLRAQNRRRAYPADCESMPNPNHQSEWTLPPLRHHFAGRKSAGHDERPAQTEPRRRRPSAGTDSITEIFASELPHSEKQLFRSPVRASRLWRQSTDAVRPALPVGGKR